MGALETKHSIVDFADEWVQPSIGIWGQAFEQMGLRNDHGRMVGLCVQWVGICSQFNAMQLAQVPIRLYRRATGRGNGRKIKSGSRLQWLRKPISVGVKASQYAENAGDIEEVTSHPILDLLNKPNPWMGGIQYMRMLYNSLELADFYEKYTETGDSIQLLPMLAKYTRIQTSTETLIGGYLYGADEGSLVRYDPEIVLHHKHMPALDNMIYGRGPLRNILSESNIFAMAIDYELNGMVNGIRPSEVVFNASSESNNEQIKTVQEWIRKNWSGPKRSGTPLVTRDMEPHLLSRTAVEMEYRQGMQDMKSMTLAAFGIPDSLLTRTGSGGDGMSQSGSKSDSAYENYAQFTLTPRLASVTELRNNQLLPLMGVASGDMWLAADDPCPMTLEEWATTGAVLVDKGVFTPNEVRQELGRDPDPDGDSLRYAGKTYETMDSPMPAPSVLPGKLNPRPVEKTFVTKDVGPDDELTEAPEAAMERAVGKWFALAAEFYERITSTTGGDVGTEPMPRELDEAFVTLTHAPQLKASVTGWNVGVGDSDQAKAYKRLGSLGEQAEAAMRANQLSMIKGIDDTTRDMLRNTLAEGLRAGETQAKLRERVSRVLVDDTKFRAKVIAATETSRAFNEERLRAWDESGVMKSKEWLKSGDPCPLCRSLAEKGLIPLAAEFAPGIKCPPGHPLCRCSVAAKR